MMSKIGESEPGAKRHLTGGGGNLELLEPRTTTLRHFFEKFRKGTFEANLELFGAPRSGAEFFFILVHEKGTFERQKEPI